MPSSDGAEKHSARRRILQSQSGYRYPTGRWVGCGNAPRRDGAAPPPGGRAAPRIDYGLTPWEGRGCRSPHLRLGGTGLLGCLTVGFRWTGRAHVVIRRGAPSGDGLVSAMTQESKEVALCAVA